MSDRRLARTIMVQGTASSAGKSILVTALCRILRQDGWSVAPFKSVNMALNAAVTASGHEIGRAQAVQAAACGIEPTVEMNPVLLKPEADRLCQVVLRGRPFARVRANEYRGLRAQLEPAIAEGLAALRARHDVVVIEGAGSPAEVNLRAQDLANMHVARLADAPVLLVGDVDRGGLLASFVGTLALLEGDERARVRGLIVNRFRGDAALLQLGLDFVARRTGVPVLGIVPFLRDLALADEDSVSLDTPGARGTRARGEGAESDPIQVAIVRLPRISNHDEFQPLEREAGFDVRFVERADELAGADLVVLPGTKSTVNDLGWLRSSGLADAIVARAAAGGPTLAICGGAQMLGSEILDPHGLESSRARVAGLGLLPFRTVFAEGKVTRRVRASAGVGSFLAPSRLSVEGYEIHAGRIEWLESPAGAAIFDVAAEGGVEGVAEVGKEAGAALDGAVSRDGAVVGTLIHGLLEDAAVRAHLRDSLARHRGRAPVTRSPDAAPSPADPIDRLASEVRASLDMNALYRIAGLGRRVAEPDRDRELRIEQRDRWLVATLPGVHDVASWALVGGGLVYATTVAWHQVTEEELSPGVDARDFADRRLRDAGLDGAVLFLTSRRVAAYQDVTRADGDLSVQCIVTVGLANALRAGDPADASAAAARAAGTINVLVRTSVPLTSEALLEALALAAEARTLAVLEAGVASVVSAAPATGSGTDCIAVAAPLAATTGRAERFVGKHTGVGSLIGAAVHAAVRAGVERWLAERG